MGDQMVVRPTNGAGTQTAKQGFGEQSLEKRDTAATAIAERARAEVQSRYILAMQRPRNMDGVRVRILDHAKRPRFAAKARYCKPVGNNKSIEGPSIRFVETALQEYGNVMPESMVVFEDDAKIIVRVTVTDLERNITHAAEAIVPKTVERKFLKKGQQAISQRLNSYGDVVFLVDATDDEVANKKASAESKLIRNLGLRILPADIVEEAMEKVIATQEAEIKADPDAARKALVDAFHGVGVEPDDLVDWLAHDLAKMVPAELTTLRAVYATIRDGEGTWADVIAAKRAERGEVEPIKVETKTAPKGNEAVKERLKSKAKQQPAHDPSTGDGPPPDDVPDFDGAEG